MIPEQPATSDRPPLGHDCQPAALEPYMAHCQDLHVRLHGLWWVLSLSVCLTLCALRRSGHRAGADCVVVVFRSPQSQGCDCVHVSLLLMKHVTVLMLCETTHVCGCYYFVPPMQDYFVVPGRRCLIFNELDVDLLILFLLYICVMASYYISA